MPDSLLPPFAVPIAKNELPGAQAPLARTTVPTAGAPVARSTMPPGGPPVARSVIPPGAPQPDAFGSTTGLRQFVTLVVKGGVPVMLADAFGSPYPTTGHGALVFNVQPELFDPTIHGGTFDDAVFNDPVFNNPTFPGLLNELGDLITHNGTAPARLDMGVPGTLLTATPTGLQWLNPPPPVAITSLTQGTGIVLTPNPITVAGTIALGNTAVAAGGYGDATHVAQFTVDQQGRLTAAAAVAITYPAPPTSLPPSGPAGGALTGSYPNPTLVGGPLSNYALISSIPTTLPPNGPASGDLTGNYPGPTIKADVNLTGNPTTTTQAVDNSTTRIATTAYVVGQGYLKSATAALTYQPLDATLTALAGLNATLGLVEQTGVDVFAKRLIGVANATDIPTRADADARYVQSSTFNEQVDDRVAVLIVGGTNITTVYNDVANTLTINAAAYPTTLPPSGAASGDLAGNYPGPTLAWISRSAAQTLNIGTGGTLGSNAFTSTAYQPLDAGLTSLAGLAFSASSLVEQTALDTFATRLIGVGAGTSIPTTAQGDARWLGIAAAAGGALAGNYPNPTLVGGPLSNYLTTATAATTYLPLAGGTLTGKLTGIASLTTAAPLNLPHGVAPTTGLANGDLWTTTAGLFTRINGATVGPLGSSGTGSVTTVSVVNANGFNGTVANPTTTPAITISTTITGLLKGNGTAVSAAVAGTDYMTPGNVSALYLPLAGGTLTGALIGTTLALSTSLDVGTGGTEGYIHINEGGASNAGYVAFHKADNPRIGYLGFLNDRMAYTAEMAGGFHTFYGPGGVRWAELNSTGWHAGIPTGITAPASPIDNQLWWNSDGSAGGGQLYIRYNDGSTTQWVPAVAPTAVGGILGRMVADNTGFGILTGTIPADNTIPQISEGVAHISLAYTVKVTGSKLRIKYHAEISSSGAMVAIMALFRDSNVNAIRTCYSVQQASNWSGTLEMDFEYVHGSTAGTVVNLSTRLGTNTSIGMFLNGYNGAALFGGTNGMFLSVEEYM